MARVLLSYYKSQELPLEKVLCFWDGLSSELVNSGNDVFLLNSACVNSYHSNQPQKENIANILLDRVEKFDPEIIITFNHRIPKNILDKFDVPIVIWDGDELSYFCDLPYIKSNISRYIIFSIVKEWKDNYIDFGFTPSQIHYIPSATAIKKEKIHQVHNVSFLGSCDIHNHLFENLVKEKKYFPQFYQMIYDFLNNPNYDYVNLCRKYFSSINMEFSNRELYALFDYRWLVLANMLDLGLEVSGFRARWEMFAELAPQLAAAFNPQSVWSLEENNHFYNSSKVSLSIQHPQAHGSGFSWRCFDVMASNACLLSSYSSELKSMLNGTVKLPMFHTPYEARSLCQKLLKDNIWRNELVSQSQEYVDKHARWPIRFKEMEQILGHRLLLQKKGKLYKNIDLYNYNDSPVQVEANTRPKMNLKNKLRYKIWKHLDKKLRKESLIK